jgi:hypothetical protein
MPPHSQRRLATRTSKAIEPAAWAQDNTNSLTCAAAAVGTALQHTSTAERHGLHRTTAYTAPTHGTVCTARPTWHGLHGTDCTHGTACTAPHGLHRTARHRTARPAPHGTACTARHGLHRTARPIRHGRYGTADTARHGRHGTAR